MAVWLEASTSDPLIISVFSSNRFQIKGTGLSWRQKMTFHKGSSSLSFTSFCVLTCPWRYTHVQVCVCTCRCIYILRSEVNLRYLLRCYIRIVFWHGVPHWPRSCPFSYTSGQPPTEIHLFSSQSMPWHLDIFMWVWESQLFICSIGLSTYQTHSAYTWMPCN